MKSEWLQLASSDCVADVDTIELVMFLNSGYSSNLSMQVGLNCWLWACANRESSKCVVPFKKVATSSR